MTSFNIFVQDGEKHTSVKIGEIKTTDALRALELAKLEYGVPNAPLALVVTKSKTGEDLAKRRKEHLEQVTANYIGVQNARAKKRRAKQRYVFLGDQDLLEHNDLAIYEVV